MNPYTVVFFWVGLSLIVFYLNAMKDARNHGSRQAHPADPSKRPPTPQPYPVHPYICKNCGMDIEFQHRHTREECQAYSADPTNPDHRAQVVGGYTPPGRNDPKIMLPYYFDFPETKEVAE